MKKHIQSVRVEMIDDPDADTSSLGRYSNTAETEFAIERSNVGRGEYRYFNPASVESFKESASWIPAGTTDRRAYWHAAMVSNAAQDFARMEAYNRDEWHYVGVIAKAVVVSENGICQTLRSGGLWGIESDSGEYFKEVEGEELASLRGELESFGFGPRAIAHAFKSAQRISA